jgi:hypothetical protein
MTIEEIIKEAFSRGWNASHECATDFDYDCALNGFLSEVETEVKKFSIGAVSGMLKCCSCGYEYEELIIAKDGNMKCKDCAF